MKWCSHVRTAFQTLCANPHYNRANNVIIKNAKILDIKYNILVTQKLPYA